MNTTSINDQIREYLEKNGKHETYDEIGKRFGKPSETVRNIYRRMKMKKIEPIINNVEVNNYITELEDAVVTLVEEKRDLLNNSSTLTYVSKKPLSPKEIEELAQVNNITTFVERSWLKSHKSGIWTYSICVKTIHKEKYDFQQSFQEFLKDYEPSVKANVITSYKNFESTPSLLVIPKQDVHYNKESIDKKDSFNFESIKEQTLAIINEASAYSKIDKIVYIIGSDQFNSEWTNATTKGTPQQNSLSYQEAFKLVCDFEVEMINMLSQFTSKLKIIFVPGNHDEYVGWHLIHWLQAFFKNKVSIKFDLSTENSKFIRWSNTAMMFNHGDVIKPSDLAVLFPIRFKKEWSNCDNYLIFTGDKHHEKTLDFKGINFYQVPALSKSVSKWDDKNGYYSKGEMQAFLIKKDEGLTNIYKRKL